MPEDLNQRRLIAQKELPRWCKAVSRTAIEVDVVKTLLQSVGRYQPPCPDYQEESARNRYMLEHGEFYTPARIPRKYKREKVKNRYEMAQILALDHPELSYAEGLAFRDGLIFASISGHAWCVTEEGQVVDPTWPKPGVAYLGMKFTTESVRQHVAWGLEAEGYYPMLGLQHYYFGRVQVIPGEVFSEAGESKLEHGLAAVAVPLPVLQELDRDRRNYVLTTLPQDGGIVVHPAEYSIRAVAGVALEGLSDVVGVLLRRTDPNSLRMAGSMSALTGSPVTP